MLTNEMRLYETCENHVKEHAAYIGSCLVPYSHIDVSTVILSNSAIPGTGSKFRLNVIHNKFKYGFKHKFSVCVPPLFGNVTALRLAEFIEMTKILGAEHFVFYFTNFNKEIKQLLYFYSHIGLATVLPWNMTLDKHRLWYHGQSAAVWDCLFRTMYISELVSFNDIDEFIMPQNQTTWKEMLADLQNSHPSIKESHIAAYRFYSAFFDSSFTNNRPSNFTHSSQLLTLNVTMRTAQVSSIRTKMLVYPLRVFELGIHHLSKPMEEEFRCIMVEPEIAILNHYRNCDWNFGMNCDNTREDLISLRYESVLMQNVKDRLLKRIRL